MFAICKPYHGCAVCASLNRTGVLRSRVVRIGFLDGTYWGKGVVICWVIVCCLGERDQSPLLRTRGESCLGEEEFDRVLRVQPLEHEGSM